MTRIQTVLLGIQIVHEQYFTILQTDLFQRLNPLLRVLRTTVQHPFREVGGDFERVRRIGMTEHEVEHRLKRFKQ